MNTVPSSMRVLVVSRNTSDREALRTILLETPGVDVAGSCASASEALDAIKLQNPDLIFLDVETPDASGVDLVKTIPEPFHPNFVFITGFDDFAFDAFRAHAIDYIVKPVSAQRILLAIERARNPGQWTGTDGNSTSPQDHLAIPESGRVILVHVSDVDWIESWGDYVRVHAGGRSHVLRKKIGDVEKELDPQRFARIHRCTIVRIDFIRELRPLDHGDARLTLADNTRLRLSRTHRSSLPFLPHRSHHRTADPPQN